jgi:hypothetical protein
MSVTVDGIEQHDKRIPLVGDQEEHSVETRIPAQSELHTELARTI